MLDYFNIYRSLFCACISIASFYVICTTKDVMLADPENEGNEFNFILVEFMRYYFLLDIIIMIIFPALYRRDLIIHHAACWIAFTFNHNLLAGYLSFCEIYSAINMIPLIKDTEFNRKLVLWWKLLSIIFIRYPMWLFTAFHVYPNSKFLRTEITIYIVIPLMMYLDMTWGQMIINKI